MRLKKIVQTELTAGHVVSSFDVQYFGEIVDTHVNNMRLKTIDFAVPFFKFEVAFFALFDTSIGYVFAHFMILKY